MICAREKRIVDSQEERSQFFVGRPHERLAVCFKDRNQALFCQFIHSTERSEVVGDISFNIADTMFLQPFPRLRAQGTVRHDIKGQNGW